MSAPAASAAVAAAGAAASSVLPSVPRGVAFLRSWQHPAVPFEVRPYPYIEKGGTAASSAALGLNEHAVVKTLLFQEREDLPPIVLLQHGDASVDTKKLVKELQRTRGMHSGGAEGSPLRSAPDAAAAAPAAGGKKSKDRLTLCPAERAEQYSGYLFGGTSPFGLRDPSLRVFIESSLLSLPPCAETEYVPGRVTDTALPKEDAHLATYRAEVDEWRTAHGAASAAAPVEPPQALPPFAVISPAWVCINGGARGTLVALSVRSIAQVLQPIPISVAKPQTAAASPSPPPAAATPADAAASPSASPQP